MATHELKAGDTEALRVTLRHRRGAVNLDGCTAVLRMRPVGPGHAAFEGAAVVEQTTDLVTGHVVGKGNVRYDWGPGETDIDGVYRVEFAVTFPDGRVRTFPSKGYETVVISPPA